MERSHVMDRGARIVLVLLCAVALGTAPGCASSRTASVGGTDAGQLAETGTLGFGSALGTLFYAPFKVAYALGGTAVGGLAWLFTGGNAEVANNIIEPAVGGDYVLTPSHLRGEEPVEFFGPRDGRTYEGYARSDRLPSVSAAPPASSERCGGRTSFGGVRFGVGSATLDNAARRDLDYVAAALRNCPGQDVRVEAHTDSTGSPDANRVLSQKRAQAVRDYLVQRGVSPSRVKTASFGASRPTASNATSSGRSMNRRVEIPLALP